MKHIDQINNEKNIVELKAVNPEMKKSTKSRLKLTLPILGLFLIGVMVWAILTNNNDADDQTDTSYLTNSNGVVCAVYTPKLKCENLQTGELQEFTLPKKYQEVISISSSPDGTRLLTEMVNNDVVVTDTNFIEIGKIFDGADFANRHIMYSWAGNSNQLLISEVKREQVDADFLPVPLVVRMFDIETGENRRVYKTGEKVDVESIKVLGGNDTHIFITYDTPKNWVADDVSPPPPTISAIRLSDGLVRPVNSHQVNADNIQYNASENTFLSSEQSNNDPEKSHITITLLEDGDFGLLLRKVFEVDTDPVDTLNPLVFTSKGVLFANYGESPAPFKLVQDDGIFTELKLINNNTYGQLLSLKAMPNLQK